MGVVFFLSCLPFMGVMLFPSFVLGNASGEGGALLVPLSLSSSFSFSFSFILSSFFSSFLPHLILLFPLLPHKLFPSLFSSSPLFHLFPFLLLHPSHFPFLLLSWCLFFFFEGTACTVYLLDVIDDTTDCN